MGGSSGGGGHTPYEAPDNLKSAQRLSAIGLISLGPIRGAVTADQYQSAFFDYTPIKNSKGEWNYQNTLIRYRLGYQDQQPLEDFDASEREVSVGAEVKLEHPISRTVIDPDIDSLRITLGLNALFSQNDQGDTHGTSVQLEILINGQSRQAVTIDGKSSSRFHRSYLIDNLPPRPFTVTVRRVTPDSKSQRLQNATFWSSYTEIISTKLSYPNMAIVGIKTDSRYNPSFPNINFLLYGRLVKVPSNYDPDTRTYGSGLWRGDFKLAWTNNPAWVFYDLVTNKLAGLGQRLGDYGIDKFQLYQIAQYCDQQVPDGYGGVEPRMVANLWLTEQRDAYSVISDMASVFRAIVVWNGTQLTAIQDRNVDPVCSFTQSNVIDGKFNRQYVPLKSIFTAVEVEYADERNNYQKAIEYVADDAMIKRYGYNVKKIVAFACTSRGQARRYGKWVLETSRLEQCTISFSVGREGLQVLPGDIIEIADKSYANVNLGGRVLAINGRTVTLDAPIEVQGEKHLSYLVNDNNGQRLVRRKISQINAQNKSLVTLDSEPTGLQIMDTWALHTPLVSTQRYRVLGVAENEDGSYGITALQHEPQKERIVDEGAIFTPVSETLHKVEPQLTHLGVQPTLSGDMKISWEVTSGNGTVKYDIKILKDGKLYLFKRGESSSELNLSNLANGEYQVTIVARDAQGRILSEKVQSFTIDNPPAPKNVLVSGGLSDITVAWDFVDEVTQTEIWASETNDLANAERIAKVTANIYTHNVGPRQTRYYWLRHTRGINVGDWYQQQGLSAETGADIDEELALLNEKLSQNIIEEIIDTALPARKLGMMLYVSNPDLSQYQGQNLIYDEVANKQYMWNGNAYVPMEQEVLASAVKGIIQPTQIAAIPTSKLSGTIADGQLSSVSANKLTGTVSVANLAPIPTTKLTGTIGANQIAANSIGANAIQAGVIGAQHLGANSVSATAIQANSVGANAIQTNAVTADKLGANAVTASKIQAGAINANHLQAGQISADKLAIGLGGNLLYNPIFANPTNGVPDGWRIVNYPNAIITDKIVGRHSWVDQQTYFNNENIAVYDVDTRNVANNEKLMWFGQTNIPVVSGKTYMFSAYVSGHRMAARLYVDGRTANGGYNGNVVSNIATGTFYRTIAHASRLFVKFTVPPDVTMIDLYIMCYKTEVTERAVLFTMRPMLEECTEYTKEPSPWQNAGVTAIHGGSIVTNTITAQQIMAGTITANEIASGAIATRHLSANSVNAGHVVARALTADKLNINSLSAISANLGAVTAGSIRGVTITGNTISGNTISGGTISGANISGTTINGGTIKGARLEGATGRFTGSLEVAELIGSNIIENVSGTLTYSHTTETTESGAKRFIGIYKKTIRIGVSSVDRYISIPGYDVDIILPKNQTRDIAIQKSSAPNPSSLSARNQTFHFLVLAYAVSSARTISF